MLPVGGDGLDVRSTDINGLLDLYGIKGLMQGPARVEREQREPAAAQKQQHQQEQRQEQQRLQQQQQQQQRPNQMPRADR